MDSGIVDNQLNLALDVPESTREKTLIWMLDTSQKPIHGS